jgi:hypothetical protein
MNRSKAARYEVQDWRRRTVASRSPRSVMLFCSTASSASKRGKFCAACDIPRVRSPATTNIAALSIRSSDSFMRSAASTLR